MTHLNPSLNYVKKLMFQRLMSQNSLLQQSNTSASRKENMRDLFVS